MRKTSFSRFDNIISCSTGICGSSVDQTLVTFAYDLEWLKKQGVEVIRHGLSFEPEKFIKNEIVKDTLCISGSVCLPMLIFDDKMVSKACYPNRLKLAEICKIEYNEEEAPPIHREENCCCGVYCDCTVVKPKKSSCEAAQIAPSAAFETVDSLKEALDSNAAKILIVILFLTVLGVIAKIIF